MFTKAITRKPCKALIDGITTYLADGKPVYENAIKQHDKYVATLKELGLQVTELDADERFPDSCFVEDPAVVMERCAVITNPARDSRNGEKFEIVGTIQKFYSDDQIFHIEAPWQVNGGNFVFERRCEDVSAGYIQYIHASLAGLFAKGDDVCNGQAVFKIVVLRVNAHEQRHLLRQICADGPDAGKRIARAVFKAAAVFVGAMIQRGT